MTTTVQGQSPASISEEQAARHKAHVAGVFGRAAATYEQVGPAFFGPWAEKLVGLAGLAPGERVLDVATGRGAVLLRAAEHVGPRGHVTGVDLAPEMVAALTADVQRRGVPNATVRQMDAEALDFPDGTFDCVLCAFGLMFFPRPGHALAGFRRVLRSKGRLALSFLPSDSPSDSRWAWRQQLNKEFGAKITTVTDAPRTTDALRDAITAAGFADLRMEAAQLELRFSDPEEWWASTWSHGARASLESLDPPTLERFTQRANEHLAAQHARGELAQTMHALFVTARRPD